MRITIGLSGASGLIYGIRMLEILKTRARGGDASGALAGREDEHRHRDPVGAQ
jgi:hypothetical protein